MKVASLAVGSRVAHDGAVWTVVALAGERATLTEQGTAATRSVAITHLLTAPGSRLLDVTQAPPALAIAPLLANLDTSELRDVCERAAHIRELLTGYRFGSAEGRLPGEPRAEYGPGIAKMERYRAKADELDVKRNHSALGCRVRARWRGGVGRCTPSPRKRAAAWDRSALAG